jgi:hypothetical protein
VASVAGQRKERRTSSCQGFDEVGKVYVCGKVCMAGSFKWVDEGVALECLQHTCGGAVESGARRRVVSREKDRRTRNEFPTAWSVP